MEISVNPNPVDQGKSFSPSPSLLFIPLLVGASILFAVLIWRLLVNYCTSCSPHHEDPTAAPTLFSPMLSSPDNLSVIENCRLNGLPNSLEHGHGGCGEVYRAKLLIDAAGCRFPIPIKRIRQTPADAAGDLSDEEKKVLRHRMRQVHSEIQTASHMRHPNLLRLLAHVPRLDCHLLMYEFMPNGSLDDVLKHGGRALSWPTSYKNALGIGAGLEYLHAVHRPRVIHRDLKPANILLDEELNPRIADFGLAKVVPADVRSGQMSSNHVAGTVGYIAPEYYRTLSCTDKCDIYSFGVILAVLVMGRFPTDSFFETTDEMSIVGWIRSVMRSEDPTPAIDSASVGKQFEEQMLLVLKIACFCTYDDPKERPNSRDVRCMLAQIEH